MKRSSLAGFFVFFFIFFVMPFLVLAAPVGKVTKVEGRVDVLKAGGRAATPVSRGDSVDVGDIYRTKTNSRAEITFFNKNILRLAPATRVQVSQYSDEGNRSNQVMKLERGKVQAISSEEFIKKVSSFAEGNRFEVHTPNAVAGIRGSGMTTGYSRMVTGLFFHTGNGYFYNPNVGRGRIVNVSAGFMSFIVGMGGIPTRPVPGNVIYVGGTGFSPGSSGGTDGGSSGDNLLIQNTALDTSYVFTQQKIDIPSVYVGSLSYLEGSSGTLFIYFGDVKFYGPSTTSVPQSWTAGSVSGSVVSPPPSGSVSLSGSNNSTAQLVVTGYTNSTFTASVTNGSAPIGVGTYSGPVAFSGSANITYSGSSITGGTASGTAHSP